MKNKIFTISLISLIALGLIIPNVNLGQLKNPKNQTPAVETESIQGSSLELLQQFLARQLQEENQDINSSLLDSLVNGLQAERESDGTIHFKPSESKTFLSNPSSSGDIEPPQLIEFDFTPKTIDTSHASQIVTFTLRITDDLSGFDAAGWRFYSPSGQQVRFGWADEVNRISGDALDGVYQGAIEFPQYSETGIWYVGRVSLFDNLDNGRELFEQDLINLGFPTKLNVFSLLEDKTSPQLLEFDFTPKTIDTSEGSQTVTFTLRITDDLSGFEVADWSFYSPSRQEMRYDWVDQRDRISGNALDGVYQGTIEFPQYSETGIWHVYHAFLLDKVSNARGLFEQDFIDLGFPTELENGEVVSPALRYAPHLWFDSEESFFPTTPFFYTDDIGETSGEKSRDKYLDLDPELKKDLFTIFYHFVDLGDEIVHEYWLYYTFNDYTNKHYHDWEKVFVFVNKDTGEVRRIAASAHESWQPNNILENPGKEHSRILVEGGSHSSYVDGDEDGRGGSLIKGMVEKKHDLTNFLIAWGIANWDENDALNGQKFFVTDSDYKIEEITSEFRAKFNELKTFPNSPILTKITIKIPRLGVDEIISVGGSPPKHPWEQDEYSNPLEILKPTSKIADGVTKVIHTLENISNSIIAIFSDEILYTFVDENGNFLFGNVPPGIHEIVVNAEGFAPYIQRFVYEEGQSLGVDGSLFLVPEEEAFRLQGIVRDSSGEVLENAVVDIFDENGEKLFTTLTNENGEYIEILSSEHVYTAEVVYESKTELIEEVSGEPGDISTINVTIEVGKKSTVESIDAELQKLINDINALDVNKGIKNSLLSKLRSTRNRNKAALRFIDAERERQANNMLNAEKNILNAFMNEIKALGKKRISKQEALILKEKAEEIKNLIQTAIQTPI